MCLTIYKNNPKKKPTEITCICTFYVLHSIAAPFWLHKPSNLVLAPNEAGQLQCLVRGNPKPSLQWLVNGEPIESEYALQTLWCPTQELWQTYLFIYFSKLQVHRIIQVGRWLVMRSFSTQCKLAPVLCTSAMPQTNMATCWPMLLSTYWVRDLSK